MLVAFSHILGNNFFFMGKHLTKVGMYILVGNLISRTIKKKRNQLDLIPILKVTPLQI